MDRIEKCNEVYTELFGGEPATMESGNDPELMIILQRFIFGEVFETGTPIYTLYTWLNYKISVAHMGCKGYP